MKEQILELLNKAYTTCLEAKKENKEELKKINDNYNGETRLNKILEVNQELDEIIIETKNNTENSINKLMDQLKNRIEEACTKTPGDDFFKDLTILKELESSLTDDTKQVYFNKYKDNARATSILKKTLYKDESFYEPLKDYELIKGEIEDLLIACVNGNSDLSIALSLNPKTSRISARLTNIEKFLETYK